MRGDDAYAILKKKMQDMQGEKIQESVNRYFDEHPVQAGATAEQVQQIEQNKKDVNSLREDLSTKITKFYASSQGETHLADSDNGKITDMVLYGRSEQKQYSGKNLVKATLESTTKNGITCTNNGDGTYTLNGTANGGDDTTVSFNVGHMIAKSGKYIVVGCPKGGSSEKYNLRIGKDNIPWGTYLSSDLGNGRLIDVTENTPITLTFMIKAGHTCNNVLFKPMIVDASLYPDATYDDFEPYTGGIPSPNPDYPQEIKSVVNPTVKVCGKNLFKATLGNVTANGITCTANSDGTYILNGTCTVSTALSIIGIFDHILNEPLYLTGVPSGCGSYLALGRRDGNNILVTDGKNTKIDAGIHTDHIEFWITKGTTLNNVIFKPMLTTDPTVTYDDFEPYHEQTVTLPYTLNAIPVNSGGNVTIDGQQYIADYVDVERGKLVRMVSPVVVSDSEYITGNNNSHQVRINKYIKNTTSDKIGIILCDKLRPANANDVWNGVADNIVSVYNGESNRLTFRCTTKANDMDSALKFIKSCNIYLVLAEPEETDLTKEEITAFKALTTYYPTTNIFINSEQLDGYTVFNYPISMENGWNYVKQQIGDTRNYIYDMDARAQDTDLQAAEAYVNSEYAVALTELEV